MQQQLYGEDVAHPDTAGTLNNIGSCKMKLGQYNEALGYYNKSLLMKQQLYGEDVAHPDTAGTLNNIAKCEHECWPVQRGSRILQEVTAYRSSSCMGRMWLTLVLQQH